MINTAVEIRALASDCLVSCDPVGHKPVKNSGGRALTILHVCKKSQTTRQPVLICQRRRPTTHFWGTHPVEGYDPKFELGGDFCTCLLYTSDAADE